MRAVNSISRNVRFRLVPALLTALGVGLLATGLNSYTAAVQSPPPPEALASYEPQPSIPATVVLPEAGAAGPGSRLTTVTSLTESPFFFRNHASVK